MALTEATAPDLLADPVRLAIGTAPASAKHPLTTLFTLDTRLEQLARRTRDPLVAQMRLTWWYEALAKLDEAPAPPEPLLAAVADEVLSADLRGAELAAVASGWEILLEPRPLCAEALARFGQARGAVLFSAAAQLLGEAATDQVASAGEAWALADLATRTDPAEAASARQLALARWDDASTARWPRALRPLGVLTLLTLLPLMSRDGTGGGVMAAWRVARFRLSGR